MVIIKPYPFCGHDAKLQPISEGDEIVGYEVECTYCAATHGIFWIDSSGADHAKKCAIELWNTRYERKCEMINVGGYLRDKCSWCGNTFRLYEQGDKNNAIASHPKYCPNCGVKAVENEN